eukprot:933354-Rhodomonas_salina.1
MWHSLPVSLRQARHRSGLRSSPGRWAASLFNTPCPVPAARGLKLRACAGRIVLFSGFLVIRQNTRKSTFHTDFNGTNGKAFTLMTPLQDMSDLSECHLLAKLPHTAAHRPHTCVQSRAAAVADEWKGSNDQRKTRTASEQEKDGGGKIVNEEEEGGESKDGDRNCDDGANKKCEDRETETETETETATATETEERASELRQYRYREGRGICFGDGFMHATQTGHAPRPLAFLCFTFGVGALTDAEWKGAESYISHVSLCCTVSPGGVYQAGGGLKRDGCRGFGCAAVFFKPLSHREIKCQKPLSLYISYQECG